MELGHESPLQIEVSRDGVVVTVIVAGEVDITTATALSGHLLDVGAARRSGWSWTSAAWSSSMSRALDETYTLLQAVCPVIVRQPRPLARKVFGITGLMEN